MAIDYVLAMGCQPQKLLGVERLVELNRTRILARSALAHMAEDGVEKPPSEIHIQMTTQRAGASTGGGVTLQDLLDQAKPLDQVTPHCGTCPADFKRELACHRRIRYPIPEHVEQWLMARLPRHLACTAGALLVRGLGEFGWDGTPVAKLRAAGDTYFESRVAHGVRWESDDGNIELSSDTVLQMMFFVGRTLQPTHSLMLSLFLGVIPHDIDLHLLKDGPGRTKALAMSYLPPEADPDIEQLAAFLRMLALGAQLDVPILVDG